MLGIRYYYYFVFIEEEIGLESLCIYYYIVSGGVRMFGFRV